jgi:hypothetical protein
MDITPNGLRVQSALYQILSREQEKLSGHLAHFGLRPDARARVTLAVRQQLKLFDANAGSADAAPASFEHF